MRDALNQSFSGVGTVHQLDLFVGKRPLNVCTDILLYRAVSVSFKHDSAKSSKALFHFLIIIKLWLI